MNSPRNPHDPYRIARRAASVTDVYHHVECRHQVEIEVFPPRAELNFGDDWTANPISKQVRFEALLYNSDRGALWEVHGVGGGPGMGTIDAAGVYHAPAKGTLASGHTEVIVATAREDRLRKAYAWVTLVGVGAKPAAVPAIELYPKRVTLYYRQGAQNAYMDDSNKVRQFRATALDAVSPLIEWRIDMASPTATGPRFLYQAPNTGTPQTHMIRAQLSGHPEVFEDAQVLLLNYSWPGA